MEIKISIKDSNQELKIKSNDIINIEILGVRDPLCPEGLNYLLQLSPECVATMLLHNKTDAPNDFSQIEGIQREYNRGFRQIMCKNGYIYNVKENEIDKYDKIDLPVKYSGFW